MKTRVLLFSMVAVLALSCLAWAGKSVTASIAAQNTFTSALLIKEHGAVRISGTFSATVALQRSEDGGTTWYDTGDTFSSAGIWTFTDYTNRHYRVGVKTGGYSSGTVLIELGSGEK